MVSCIVSLKPLHRFVGLHDFLAPRDDPRGVRRRRAAPSAGRHRDDRFADAGGGRSAGWVQGDTVPRTVMWYLLVICYRLLSKLAHF